MVLIGQALLPTDQKTRSRQFLPLRLKMESDSTLAQPTEQQTKWQALTDFINQWFHDADFEALGIVLTVAASHYWVEADPIWLFIVGPASSGKTSIFINACAGLKDAIVVGDIGKDTFLSAYGKNRDRGLLSVYPNPLLLFKDFTTSLTKHPNEKAEIQSQMREIYDGEFVKDRGVGRVHWRGKATCIAACTLALDRHWGIQRDLGERFLTLRLRPSDPVEASLKAAAQAGKEKTISKEMQRLASEWIDRPTLKIPDAQTGSESLKEIAYLAQCVSWTRTHVIRDSQGARVIIEAPISEFSTRVFKQLDLLSRFSMAVKRNTELPMDWMRRIVIDSMPSSRRQIMEHIPVGSSISPEEIATNSKSLINKVKWNLDEMEAIGLVSRSGNLPVYSFTKEFTDLCEKAGFSGFQK